MVIIMNFFYVHVMIMAVSLGIGVCCYPAPAAPASHWDYEELLKTAEGRVQVVNRYDRLIASNTKLDVHICTAMCSYCDPQGAKDYPERSLTESHETYGNLFEPLQLEDNDSYSSEIVYRSFFDKCTKSCFLAPEPVFETESITSCKACLLSNTSCSGTLGR